MDQMSTLAAPRVQIIDPDGKFREALATHLRGCGYWVETCGNLDEGLGQGGALRDEVLDERELAPEAPLDRTLPEGNEDGTSYATSRGGRYDARSG